LTPAEHDIDVQQAALESLMTYPTIADPMRPVPGLSKVTGGPVKRPKRVTIEDVAEEDERRERLELEAAERELERRKAAFAAARGNRFARLQTPHAAHTPTFGVGLTPNGRRQSISSRLPAVSGVRYGDRIAPTPSRINGTPALAPLVAEPFLPSTSVNPHSFLARALGRDDNGKISSGDSSSDTTDSSSPDD
jgi:hypothetical protein